MHPTIENQVKKLKIFVHFRWIPWKLSWFIGTAEIGTLSISEWRYWKRSHYFESNKYHIVGDSAFALKPWLWHPVFHCTASVMVFPPPSTEARRLISAPLVNHFVINPLRNEMKPWLLIPYKQNANGLSLSHKRFNRKLSVTRVCVGQAFGDLQNRFRRVQDIDAKVEKCVLITATACIFHNICISNWLAKSALEWPIP